MYLSTALLPLYGYMKDASTEMKFCYFPIWASRSSSFRRTGLDPNLKNNKRFRRVETIFPTTCESTKILAQGLLSHLLVYKTVCI
jgi:hypothetical protein